MIQPRNAWQSYREVAVHTASPGHLVLMLYDGAIRFLEKSLTGFLYQDPAQFHQTINNNLIRAQAIIREMNARLDMERGGEVAENFRRLYTYFNGCLQQANLKKNKELIEEVIGHLRELREAWAEMLSPGDSRKEETTAARPPEPA